MSDFYQNTCISSITKVVKVVKASITILIHLVFLDSSRRSKFVWKVVVCLRILHKNEIQWIRFYDIIMIMHKFEGCP